MPATARALATSASAASALAASASATSAWAASAWAASASAPSVLAASAWAASVWAASVWAASALAANVPAASALVNVQALKHTKIYIARYVIVVILQQGDCGNLTKLLDCLFSFLPINQQRKHG